MLDKIEKTITEKSEKIMTNEKVEGFVNNVGGMLCFIGAVVFGIMFIVGGASLIKTGKNYVVKPSKEEKKRQKHRHKLSPLPQKRPNQQNPLSPLLPQKKPHTLKKPLLNPVQNNYNTAAQKSLQKQFCHY